MFVIGAAAGFLAGIATGTLYAPSFVYVMAVALFGAAVCLTAFFLKEKKKVIVVSLALLFAALGMWRATDVLAFAPTPLDALLGERVTVEGVITDEPDVREKSVLLTVDVHTLHEDGETTPATGKVLAVMPAYTEGMYGDRVRLSGVLQVPEAFETDTGRVFDYPGYLLVRGIRYSMPLPILEKVGTGEGNLVLAVLYDIKRVYLEGLAVSIPEPAAALAGGITVGTKRSLGEAMLEDFRKTGVIHIVVLSGYNMTIIAIFLMWLLSFLPLRFGLTAGIVGIVLFALMTGGSASIVRASIMAVLALLARMIGRTYVITRALMLAIVGMVVWNPLVLLYDPGFQLSVLATIGLVYLSPLIEERLSWVPKVLGMRMIVGATVGTQLTVLPFLLYQMGEFSVAALPVNLLVLPVVPLAMFASFVASIISLAVPFAALLAGLPAYALLSYVFVVVETAASIPFAALAVPVFPIWIMVVAYAVMFGGLWWVYRKRNEESE